MDNDKNLVANIQFNKSKPTSLSFHDLYTWTIWQFPAKIKNGLSGAVRPPIPGHTWYPAIIQAKEKNLQVFAHLNRTFSSPEKAAEYLGKKSL